MRLYKFCRTCGEYETADNVDDVLEAASDLADDARVREYLNRARSIRSTINHLEDGNQPDAADLEDLDLDADELAREIEADDIDDGDQL